MNQPFRAGVLAGLAVGLTALFAPAQNASDAAASKDGQTTAVALSRSGMPEHLSVMGTPARATLTAEDANGSVMTGTLTLDGADYAVKVTCPGADEAAKISIGGDDGAEVESSAGQSQRGRTTWTVNKNVTLGGSDYRVLSINQGQGRDGSTSTMLMVASSPLYGKTTIDGAERHLALLDADGDGAIQGSGDRWLLLTDAELEAFNSSARGGSKAFNTSSMTRADHPVFLGDGRAVFLGAVDGGQASLTTKKAEHDLSHYLHQRAADINAGYTRDLSQYDEGREKAETPIAWTYALDLEPLLAKAKEQGKPLLIDFETDWCGWCHVLDLVTYPDKEVAAFVNENFIPVKWNCELDPHATHNKYEVRGFPSMVVVHPDGTKIDATVGFKKASEFLAELKKLHAAAQEAMNG